MNLRALSLLLLAGTGCAAGDRDVTLRFDARFGSEPFACGRDFAGIGTSGGTVTPLDFRVYVHDVALVRAGGERVPLTIVDDEAWQHDGLVLLDFEDGSGACMTGSPLMNSEIRGTAPDHDDYTGVQFLVGVPDAQNYLDGATPRPRSTPRVQWWSWAGGHKYIRLDVRPTSQPEFFYYLGATRATAASPRASPANTTTWRRSASTASTPINVIKIDGAAILAGVDVDKVPDGMTDTLPGCMAFPGDPECPAMMAPLGLRFESDEASTTQTVFFVAE